MRENKIRNETKDKFQEKKWIRLKKRKQKKSVIVNSFKKNKRRRDARIENCKNKLKHRSLLYGIV